MSTRAVAAIRPVPLSSQAPVPSDPVRQRRLYAYQAQSLRLNMIRRKASMSGRDCKRKFEAGSVLGVL
jgi:hypothetical protein